MLAVVPPEAFAAKVSTSRLPALVYAINGVMPIAICLRHGLWWAGILGAVAMSLPLVISRLSETFVFPFIIGG